MMLNRRSSSSSSSSSDGKEGWNRGDDSADNVSDSSSFAFLQPQQSDGSSSDSDDSDSDDDIDSSLRFAPPALQSSCDNHSKDISDDTSDCSSCRGLLPLQRWTLQSDDSSSDSDDSDDESDAPSRLLALQGDDSCSDGDEGPPPSVITCFSVSDNDGESGSYNVARRPSWRSRCERSADDSSEDHPHTNITRTIRNRNITPDGLLHALPRKPKARPEPKRAKKKPLYGPHPRPQSATSVERHHQDVLYGHVETLNDVDVLYAGLTWVNYTKKRLENSSYNRNVDRFVSHYGVGPLSVEAMLKDLKAKYPTISYRDTMMALNWMKGYHGFTDMEPTWDRCKEYIGPKVKAHVQKIASLKDMKIRFEDFDDDDIIIFTVDGVNFITEEFRMDPHGKWFDHKSKSSGLTYEFAVSLKKSALIWINGPFPASRHDSTVFRGGRKDTKKEDWDHDALYWKMPKGTKGIGDSGYVGIENIIIYREEHSLEFKEFMGRAKNRQETLHSRLKSFNVLKSRFRHGQGTQSKMAYHKICVEAVCVMVQYSFENGNSMFELGVPLK